MCTSKQVSKLFHKGYSGSIQGRVGMLNGNVDVMCWECHGGAAATAGTTQTLGQVIPGTN
jgi:hypothetical protein